MVFITSRVAVNETVNKATATPAVIGPARRSQWNIPELSDPMRVPAPMPLQIATDHPHQSCGDRSGEGERDSMEEMFILSPNSIIQPNYMTTFVE